MNMPNRPVLGCLGVIGLALIGTGALVVLNRQAVFKHLAEAWDMQVDRTQATLFRWGELMSISSELKARYGAEPDVTYDTSTRDRTLRIRFSTDPFPERGTTEAHAREIAAFAVGKTKKLEQIDAVRVQFQGVETTDGSASFTFALDELVPSPSRATDVVPDPSAATSP